MIMANGFPALQGMTCRKEWPSHHHLHCNYDSRRARLLGLYEVDACSR